MPVELLSANPAVRSVVEGKAPRAARLAAARGILPLPIGDVLEMLVHLTRDEDEELAAAARETLVTQDHSNLETFISTENVPSVVLEHFCGQEGLSTPVYEAIFRHAGTPESAIISFAKKTGNPELLEVLALNQQLLVRAPELIEAIIANSKSTPEADRRAKETRKEFFEKERGANQIANELRAQGKDAAADFIERAEFAGSIGEGGMSAEDAIFLARHIEVPDSETDDSWLALEYIEEIYEETEADRKATLKKILGEWEMDEDSAVSPEKISMLNRIMQMGVKDRVRMAMMGDREARNILIRDPNKLVAQAVANNPRITEKEVENIAAMRSIPEDVLRQIAVNRQWLRSYPIMHNLARNPRAPLANVMTIMTRLQMRDLVALSKNRNVSDAVRRQALRLHQARVGKQ